MTTPQAFDLGLQHHRAGRLAEAEALYRQILAVQPKHSEALHFLGVIAHQVGRDDLAVELIRQSVVLNPNNPDAHSNLGEACRVIGCLDEAIAAFRRALQIRADHPEAHNNLGLALASQGRMDEALAAYNRALELKPDYPDAYNNLGIALSERGRLDEAIAAYQHALQLQPDYPDAHNNLGTALGEQGQLDGAIAAYRHALRFKPQDPKFHSNLIYALHFHPGYDGGKIAEEHRRWNRLFSEPMKQCILPRPIDRDPDRRLRVGYVSPDFRDHVVGRNLLPLFECHDPRKFEILCYAEVAQPDPLTEEFRRRAHQWRSTVGVGDEALAKMIRQDGVDILVDLAQHMAGNRLPMFARKPAPIQVSFAGYPESAGLEAIGYRISDRYLEPGSANEGTGKAVAGIRESGPSASAEERVCLIDSFWCFDPRGVELEVNGLPAKEGGNVTFGCLNNFCKVNEPVLNLWARVLGKVTSSRMVLLSRAGTHRQRTLETFESKGVESGRIEFVELRPRREYLELYHRLDIVLDTAPYNGHSTSLDALWMGVPVVSLAGNTAVSRAGLSQLTNLGLPELIARSEADYLRIAVDLAADLPRLAQLRSSLRDRMKSSVLMDAPRFARQVEQAYREIWQAWRPGQPPIPK